MDEKKEGEFMYLEKQGEGQLGAWNFLIEFMCMRLHATAHGLPSSRQIMIWHINNLPPWINYESSNDLQRWDIFNNEVDLKASCEIRRTLRLPSLWHFDKA
jgi:hypothetical protein